MVVQVIRHRGVHVPRLDVDHPQALIFFSLLRVGLCRISGSSRQSRCVHEAVGLGMALRINQNLERHASGLR